MVTKLVDIISRASTTEVIQHLRRTPENRWVFELTQCNPQGQTPLRLAIERGNLEIIKVLLSFNAPINDEESYAQELAINYPQEPQHQRVYALVRSRKRWLNNAANNQDILFSRSMQAIEEAIDKIQGAVKKTGVLFFGITGEGKSTFVNYLYGVDYRIEGKLDKKAIANGTEVASVGDSTTSLTLLPQVIEHKSWPYVLIDLPGFEDTRGTAEEICAAASIYLLTRQLSAIQAIPMVCSWSSLQGTKMTTYRIAAYNIGAMISRHPKVAENLILVVTKPDKDLSQDDVRERLLLLAKEEKWNNFSSAEHVKRKDVDEDTWKKYCLRLTTEALLSRQENIVIADITTPKARTFFQKMVDALQDKKKNPDLFDFKNYSHFMVQFQSVLMCFVSQYIEMSENHQHLLTAFEKTREAIEKKNFDIDMLEKDKQELAQFNQEPYLKRISDIQNEIQKLKAILNSLTIDKGSLEQEVRQYQNDIIYLESCSKDYDLKKDAAHTSARQKAEAAFDSALNTTHKIYAIEKEVIEPTYFRNLFSSGGCIYVSFDIKTYFLNIVDEYASKNARYQADFEKIKSIWSAAFDVAISAHQSAQLTIRQIDEEESFNARRSQDLRRQLQLAQQFLNIHQNNIWTVEDQIREQDLLLIAEHQKLKDSQAFYDTRLRMHIAKSDKILSELKIELDFLSKEDGIIFQKILLSSLEQEVNQNLFSKIRTIIQTLDLKNKLIDRFMSLYPYNPYILKVNQRNYGNII